MKYGRLWQVLGQSGVLGNREPTGASHLLWGQEKFCKTFEWVGSEL